MELRPCAVYLLNTEGGEKIKKPETQTENPDIKKAKTVLLALAQGTAPKAEEEEEEESQSCVSCSCDFVSKACSRCAKSDMTLRVDMEDQLAISACLYHGGLKEDADLYDLKTDEGKYCYKWTEGLAQAWEETEKAWAKWKSQCAPYSFEC